MIKIKPTLHNTSPRRVQFASVAALIVAVGSLSIPSLIAQSSAQNQLPQVRLDAEGLAPRPIEELTGATVARHYALAWRDLAVALESSRTDRLNEEFTGFARDRLAKRIAEQQQTGVHIQIVDRGHTLKALFYSADGASMQLLDQANLEIQTFDGSKLLDVQSAPRQYIVLMTPGADRWYVRDLEEIPAQHF